MKLISWTAYMLAKHPETLLSLLIRAQKIDQDGVSVSSAYRSGILMGAAHPEIADQVRAGLEMDYPQKRKRRGFRPISPA